MIEKGIITNTEFNFATVKVDKKAECSKCGMCAFPKNAGYIEFNAENKINAKIGDTVYIEKKENGKFLSIVFIFFIPLILIAISTLLGICVLKNELSVLIISVALIAVWFFVLSFIDKVFKKKFNNDITIIKKESIDTKE